MYKNSMTRGHGIRMLAFISPTDKMKYGRLILGGLLLIGAGRELASVSRQLNTYLEPGSTIAVLLFMILCTWLMAGAFPRKEKLKIKSREFLKFYLGSLILVFIVFRISAVSLRTPLETYESNGITVLISDCLEGSRKFFPNEPERRDYCTCTADKLTSSESIRVKYKEQLKDGKFQNIIENLKSNPIITSLNLEDCINMQAMNMDWTENIVNQLRSNWKEELANTEFEQTNDIDRYCDCLLTEYQKYPMNKVFADDFNESEEGMAIDEKCTNESLK